MSGAGILENLELINKARYHSTQIFLASGAIIGLDGLSAVSEGEVNFVKMITRKPPNALINAKFVLENNIKLDNLNEPKLIFSDNAFEGAKAFPAHVNVAAAVGLAGVGAKKTHLEIWADPKLSKNTHSILVKSDSSNFKIEIENVVRFAHRTNHFEINMKIKKNGKAAGHQLDKQRPFTLAV